MQKQPPIISIKMVPAGVDMVLAGLNKLPREESDGLYQEILAQFQIQIHELVAKKKAEQEEAEKQAAAQKKAVPAKKIKLVKKVVKK